MKNSRFISFRHRLRTACAASAAAVLASSLHADVTLVRDGRPLVTLVSEAPAEDPVQPKKGRKGRASETPETKAVKVLAEWIKKITDAEVPLSNEAPVQGPAIYVGRAALKAGLKLDDIASVSHEGVRIVVDDNRVLIAGQNDEATYKAVCRFLEELGCRYFMEGPLGEEFPRTTTLVAKSMSLTEKPGLIGRNPKGPSWRDLGWRAWNGAGGDMVQHQHSWGSYVPEKLFDEHPEWFAMGADGERKRGGWLCTSNPEMRKHFADQVIAAIERGQKNPSLSPTDGRGYCQCAKCRAQDDPKSIEPSSGTVAVTNRYVDFFDDVARQVAAVHPDSVLSFYCYADYTQPPTVARKLSPNLCAVIAPIRYCRLHEIGHKDCASREQQLALTDGWAAVASKLGYYNYMYNLADGTLPSFKFTACQKEFPYLASKGLSYMTIEMLTNWHIYGPQMYLSLRLAYDPQAAADAIMEDYWQKFYGPAAAPFMKAYWMGIDAEVGKLNSHAGSFYGLQQIYTPAFLKKCDELLSKAAAAARGNEKQAQRVALHTEGFQSAVQYRQISDAMARGDFAKAEEVLDAMTTRLSRLAKEHLANPEYATSYLGRFLSKPVRAGAAALASPNKLLQVLPHEWRLAVEEEGSETKGYQRTALDDSKWPVISTYPQTLDAQGFDRTAVLWFRNKFIVPQHEGRLALFFGEVDGVTEVFVNGTRIAVPENPDGRKKSAATPSREGTAGPRAPFEVDVTAAARAGDNCLALRVDHSKITDLSLGGILRPVLLIEKK